MKVYALLLCAAVSGGCAGSMDSKFASMTTQIAHGMNAMYEMHATFCGTPETLATKPCQKAAGYYEFASCTFERVNESLGGAAVSKACEP
jgi:hypothetical protein